MKEVTQIKSLMESMDRLKEDGEFQTPKDIFNDPWGYRSQLSAKANNIAATIEELSFSEDSLMDARTDAAYRQQFMKTFKQMMRLEKMLDKVQEAAKTLR